MMKLRAKKKYVMTDHETIVGRRKKPSTDELVRAHLARLHVVKPVVLALVPSSKIEKPPYPITMGSNNAVFCPCEGFKHRSACRHMDIFRKGCKVQRF